MHHGSTPFSAATIRRASALSASSPMPVAYNPYLHTSRSPLNDQFSSAWNRPELVTVEVEVPESELSSGYHADKAKNAVGEVDWKAGPVSSQLAKQGKPRKWGFWTNSSTKPAIIGHLITCVREHLWIERDAYAIEELALYERNDKGQFSAPAGKGNHDDVVMATAIGLWICNREMETPAPEREPGSYSVMRRTFDPNSASAL